MSVPGSRWFTAGFFALSMAVTVVAQESPPHAQDGTATADQSADPAQRYLDLKKSKDRVIRALAERYEALMRVQDWSDVSGKFKTKAKYVEHDPEMKWVKLSTPAGKESTIQLSQLDKSSLAKVKQIAALQKKLDELAAEEKTDASGAGERSTVGREGYGERSGRGERGEKAQRESGVRPLVPGPRARQEETAEPQVVSGPPHPWQTSYEVFRANFSATKDESGEWSTNFGELQDLQAQAERLKLAKNPEKTKVPIAERQRIQKAASGADKRLGEVTWEAKFKKYRHAGAEDAIDFDLPTLPEPFEVSFRVDKKGGSTPEQWKQFSAGDRINFKGKVSMANDLLVVVRVREPQLLQPATAP